MLHPFGPDIWLADGPEITAAAGFHYPTRMAIVRLSDGGLWLWSPVHLTPALLEAVEALGPVRHLVAPNSLHHMALSDWAQFCPGAQIHAAPRLAAKRRDLAFTSELGEDAPPDWAGQIDQIVVRTRITDEVVFFYRASGTVIFTDLLQQMPRGWYRGWRGLVARMDGMVGQEPQVPRKFRLALKDKPALRRVQDWPVERVVMAHGTPVTDGAAAFLDRAFAWMG